MSAIFHQCLLAFPLVLVCDITPYYAIDPKETQGRPNQSTNTSTITTLAQKMYNYVVCIKCSVVWILENHFIFIEILCKMLPFKGDVLIYAGRALITALISMEHAQRIGLCTVYKLIYHFFILGGYSLLLLLILFTICPIIYLYKHFYNRAEC